jgi:hypothetical protein
MTLANVRGGAVTGSAVRGSAVRGSAVRGSALLALVLVPWMALASVGTITRQEGSATRTPQGGKPLPLKVGDPVEVNDLLRVGPGGNLKLTLTDESVVLLGAGSELRLDEATFEGQDRKGFRAYLSVGRFWASVKKALAGSDAKFEVTTDRAVAGVRGTIFRVDAVAAMKATSPAPRQKRRTVASTTVVRVEEGRVGVEARVRKAQAAPPVAQGAEPQPGRRVLVQGPQEVTAEEWERRFVELQRGQQVTVGPDLWEEGQFELAAPGDDAFGRFIEANRPAGD